MTAPVAPQYYHAEYNYAFTSFTLAITTRDAMEAGVDISGDGLDLMQPGATAADVIAMFRAFGQAYADANGIEDEVTLVQLYARKMDIDQQLNSLDG